MSSTTTISPEKLVRLVGTPKCPTLIDVRTDADFGAEAQQLAIYVGWLLHRTMGGLVAGVLFILPGFLSILALSFVYVIYGEVGVVEGLFFGLKAAVLAVVLQAVLRIGGRVLKNPATVAIAIVAFVAIFAFNIPFPVIILAAALVGYVGGRSDSPWFRLGGGHGSGKDSAVPDADTALGDRLPDHARPKSRLVTAHLGRSPCIMADPRRRARACPGQDDVFSQIAVFFSQMALVTFGGAYAVLGYVAQEAVQNFGWLEPGEMLDGLGMAETTPGPLIMVVQFVGFLAAYREADGLHPLAAATFGAILTTWVTFVPCFLWIFLGAPFIERLRDNVALTGAMTAITNLAIWFSIHALFGEVVIWRGLGTEIELPLLHTLDWTALALTAAAVIAVFGFKVGMIKVLLACAVLGAAFHD